MNRPMSNDAQIKITANDYIEAMEKLKELEAYKKAAERYKSVLNSMDASFALIEVIFDSLGKIADFLLVECNPALETQMGIVNPLRKSIKHIPALVEDNLFEIFGKVALTGEAVCFVKEFKTLKKWFSIDLYKIKTAESANIAVFFKDITDKVKVKEDLEKTIKIQDEIFANVSHELKTPLSVIFGTAQLLELYSKKFPMEGYKEKVDRSIGIIKQNCYRFTKLVNNIIDLSKMDSGFYNLNLKNENIIGIVENIVQSVTDYVKDKGLSIVFYSDLKEKVINCDPEKIERIMLNLISNAIKFSNNGGKIFVNICSRGDVVEIAVRDTGIGIDKSNLESIFDRFQQVDKTLSRNAEGSGIGLSLVKSIVELHGGKVSVESEVGKGSIFKVELPAQIVECTKEINEKKLFNNKIEMINIEFSDIYGVMPTHREHRHQNKDLYRKE